MAAVPWCRSAQLLVPMRECDSSHIPWRVTIVGLRCESCGCASRAHHRKGFVTTQAHRAGMVRDTGMFVMSETAMAAAQPAKPPKHVKPPRVRAGKTSIDQASYQMLRLYRSNLEIRFRSIDEAAL